MVILKADARAIEAVPDPEGERLASAALAQYLEVRLVVARLLLRLERAGTYHLSGCSSIVQYAARRGVPPAEARMLVDLARALETATSPEAGADAEPSASVEQRVLGGTLPVESAAQVGRLLAQPGLVRPGEDWFAKAESLNPMALRREVDGRIEEAAQGDCALVPITLHVTAKARHGFARARVLASRAAEMRLTEGQTFALIVRHYLAAVDTQERSGTTRRAGPTAERHADRYIPASVRRTVTQRSGDRCEVPACTFDTFLEFAHIEAHADGGSREADNLLRLCSVHHVQLDAGWLRPAPWREGCPVFRDVSGREIARRTGERGASTGARDPTCSAHAYERPPPVCR